MENATLQKTQTALFSAAAVLFAFGASEAYASDQAQKTDPVSSIKVYEKTAVSSNPPLIRKDVIPPRPVIELNTQLSPKVDGDTKVQFTQARYDTKQDLREFDLVEDSPVFIGARGVDELDTLEAKRESGSYPQSLNVDPLFTVAGAGVATSF